MRLVPALVAVSAASAALVGCTAAAEPEHTGPYPPGTAPAAQTFFGVEYAPCTDLQSEAYPSSIDTPSGDYYAGPWCRRVSGGTSYLWTYARELTSALTPAEVRKDVNHDALTMVADLKAQGYVLTCGTASEKPDAPDVNAGFAKPGSTTRLYLAVRGQDVTGSGRQASSAGSPLSLAITRTEGQRAAANPPVLAAC